MQALEPAQAVGRNLRDCLAEELRRLDPDVLFGDVVKHGVPQLRESIAG